jgi:hypothetical protein
LLGLQTYFTAGPKEVRAWTIPVGATAPNAAGKIHTDFEKGFIRAEVISYADFIANNGEQGAKDAGRWRLEGKDYIVQDGDVIHFRFNVKILRLKNTLITQLVDVKIHTRVVDRTHRVADFQGVLSGNGKQ